MGHGLWINKGLCDGGRLIDTITLPVILFSVPVTEGYIYSLAFILSLAITALMPHNAFTPQYTAAIYIKVLQIKAGKGTNYAQMRQAGVSCLVVNTE